MTRPGKSERRPCLSAAGWNADLSSCWGTPPDARAPLGLQHTPRRMGKERGPHERDSHWPRRGEKRTGISWPRRPGRTCMVTSCRAAPRGAARRRGLAVRWVGEELLGDVRPGMGGASPRLAARKGAGLLVTRRRGGGRRSLIKTLGSPGRERSVANTGSATRGRGRAEPRRSRARAATRRPHGARHRFPVPAPLPACGRRARSPGRARAASECLART